jgi:3',5'-cyclic AMP phosphodiesterase CpdA
MPLILRRRAFLQGALASAAAASAAVAQSRPRTHWALLSDVHVSADPADRFRGFSPAANLTKAVSQVQGVEPDGTLISGDVARLQGLKEDYQTVRTLLDPLVAGRTLALTLGNHDDRKNFFQVFAPASQSPVRDRQVVVFKAPPLRFILLDSLLVTNIVPGLLGRDQRTWLEQYLKSSDATPTVIVVHHPPDDADNNLLDGDRLVRMLAPVRKVKAVIFGHTHNYRYDTLEDLHLVNLPAVGYNFADTEPVGWVEARMGREGADFKLHAIGGNTAQDGQVKSIAWRA